MYDYDLFLSYARRNNERPAQWVTRFRRGLEIVFDEKLCKVRIFMDVKDIEGGNRFDERIYNSLRKSAVLLFVASSASLDPGCQWCSREREEFIRAAGGPQGIEDRVFVVNYDGIDPRDLPEPIRTFTPYRFYEEDESTKQIRPALIEEAGRFHTELYRLRSHLLQAFQWLGAPCIRLQPRLLALPPNDTADSHLPTVSRAEQGRGRPDRIDELQQLQGINLETDAARIRQAREAKREPADAGSAKDDAEGPLAIRGRRPTLPRQPRRIVVDFGATPVAGMTRLLPKCRLEVPDVPGTPRLDVRLDHRLRRSGIRQRQNLRQGGPGQWEFQFDLPLVDQSNQPAYGMYGILFLVEYDEASGHKRYYYNTLELQLRDQASLPREKVEIDARDSLVNVETGGPLSQTILIRAHNNSTVQVRPSVGVLSAGRTGDPPPADDSGPRVASLDLQEYYPDDVRVEFRFDHEVLSYLQLIGKGVNDEVLAYFAQYLDPHREQFELRGMTVPTCFRETPNLRTLHLHESNITDHGLAFVAELEELRTLRLDKTNISDDGVRRLRPLVNLQNLWLSNTRITDASLSIIGRFSELRSLHLEFTRITNQGLDDLATLRRARSPALPRLKQILLTGTDTTEERRSKLLE